MHFYFSKNSFSAQVLFLKSPPVVDKNIQSCVGEMAGRGPKVGKVCVCLAFCMVVPSSDALDT